MAQQKSDVRAGVSYMRVALRVIMGSLLAIFLLIGMSSFGLLLCMGFPLAFGGLHIRNLAQAVKQGKISRRKAASRSLAVSAGVYAMVVLFILAARPVLIPPFEELTVREIKLANSPLASDNGKNRRETLRVADDPQEFSLEYASADRELRVKLARTHLPDARLRIWISGPEYRRWNESEHLIWQLEADGDIVLAYERAAAYHSQMSWGHKRTNLELAYVDFLDRYFLAPVEWLFGVRKG